MRLLACSLLCLLAVQEPDDPRWVVYEPGDVEGGGGGRHIVLVSGDEEYRSEEALPMLGQILARRHGFRCTVLFAQDPETGVIDPDNQGHIPGLAALDGADLLVLFTRFRRLPDADMKHIVDFVESGKPVLGLRTATHAFRYEADSESPYAHWSFRSQDAWPGGFGRQILGETWIAHHGHHGRESTRGLVPVSRREHPVVRGVEDVWGPTDVYAVTQLPKGSTVLLAGSVRAGMTPDAPAVDGRKNAPMHPVAWARELPRKNAPPQRIVCSTIAAAIDLASEDLRRLMVNACYWGLRLPVPARADVTPLTPFHPTMYGFGGYRQGVHPTDHALPPSDPR